MIKKKKKSWKIYNKQLNKFYYIFAHKKKLIIINNKIKYLELLINTRQQNIRCV